MRRPPVVILSGVRWGFLWQRHQTLATRFARAGYPTVFVETTGLANPRIDRATLHKVAARLRGPRSAKKAFADEPVVHAPLALPPTLGVFRGINRRLLVPRMARHLRRLYDGPPVVVAYPPTRTTLDAIRALDPRLVLYDRADDYGYFPGVPRDIAATERELLARADLVCCTSLPLLEDTRRLRPDAFLSGPAVDYDLFAPLQRERPTVPPRTVCFFGYAGRERLNLDVLEAVARAGIRVRLIGGVDRTAQGLLSEPNVEWRGEVDHAGLPAALAGVDAFVLPYGTGGLTRSISPAKIFECLASGRPVVASPLPALRELAGPVLLADGPGAFVRVLRALETTENEEKARARVRLARENSWDARFADLEGAILDALGER